MNLQAALVILVALGVNGLPAPELKKLEQPPIATSIWGCAVGDSACLESHVGTGKAKREDIRRTHPAPALWSPLPTQRPQAEKRQKNTEGFGPPPRPNIPKERLPPRENNSEIGTSRFPPKPTDASSPLFKRSIQRTPLEKPDKLTHAGQPSSCNGWYTVKHGDTCDYVTKKFDIKKEKFLEWNPALSKNCDKNFWVDYSYCVKVSGSKKAKRSLLFTSTTPSLATPFGADIEGRSASYTGGGGATFKPVTITAAKRAVPPPTATPSSSPEPSSTCLQFDITTEDDTCETMVAKHGLTVTELRILNSDLGNICTSIKPGLNYCVRELRWLSEKATPNIVDLTSKLENEPEKQDETPATTTNQPTEPITECARQWFVGTKDTCESIASVAGISVAELVALNPVTLANCDSITRHTPVCLLAAKPIPPLPTPSHGGVPVGTPPVLSPAPFTNYTKAP